MTATERAHALNVSDLKHLPARCRDCGNTAQTQTFDGRRFRESCWFCAIDRAKRRPPTWQLEGDDLIVGRAAVCNVVFQKTDAAGTPIGQREMWRRGCFRRSLPGRHVALRANHVAEAWCVIASTRNGTLVCAEDLAGLCIVARLHRGAVLQYDGGTTLNVHDAIADGRCAGLSIYADGGTREPSSLGAFADVTIWHTVNLEEVSLIVPPDTQCGSPGTWIQHGDQRAMERLQMELRETAHLWS